MVKLDIGNGQLVGDGGQFDCQPWSVSLAKLFNFCGDGGQIAGVLHQRRHRGARIPYRRRSGGHVLFVSREPARDIEARRSEAGEILTLPPPKNTDRTLGGEPRRARQS